jgi:hypothetical protein
MWTQIRRLELEVGILVLVLELKLLLENWKVSDVGMSTVW